MRAAASRLVLATGLLSFVPETQGRDLAADPPRGDLSLLRAHGEAPRHPWVPRVPGPSVRLAGGGSVVSVGPYTSIQVNVDGAGNNLSGDAANEPSMAVKPSAPNRIVIGWRQFDSVASDFRQAGYGFSDDGGRSWTFPGVIQPGEFRSDPVVEVDSAGNFYFMSLTRSPTSELLTDLFTSTDGGETWGSATPAFGGDKEWIAVDRTGGVGEGNIYNAWSLASPFSPNQFSRSTDGGASFQPPIPIVPTAIIFGTVAVGGDGAVYISGINDVTGAYHVAKSTNAQNPAVTPTFDFVNPVNLGGALAIFIAASPNPVGILGQSWVTVDPGNPATVYLLSSVDPPGADPLDVHVVRSPDGGMSWGAPVRVNDDAPGTNAYQWFGTLSVAPNGRLDAIWNDTRNDPANPNPTTSELFYSSSSDGGASWSPNVAVSPAFNHSLGYPQQQKLGDYYQTVSDNLGVHVAYAATFNGEQDVYYLRIGSYDCNQNNVADETDVASMTSDDCNGNVIPDECELASGADTDQNSNGVLDTCENQPPVCPAAVSVQLVSSPNHQFALVEIQGVTDPDGDPISIAVTAVTQDEAVKAGGAGSGSTCPDAVLVDTDGDGIAEAAGVLRERDGTGNGRVYRLTYTAADPLGADCTGTVTVCVPRSAKPGAACTDDGQAFDSLVCPAGGAAPAEGRRVYSLEEFSALTPEPLFIRGDIDWDDELSITDPILILSRLFLSDEPLRCPDAADVNDDGEVDVSDAVACLSYLFVGSFIPPPPRGAIGPDPTIGDALRCE